MAWREAGLEITVWMTEFRIGWWKSEWESRDISVLLLETRVFRAVDIGGFGGIWRGGSKVRRLRRPYSDLETRVAYSPDRGSCS